MMDFRIQLDVFRGPLDLLLHLVRKHEVEITEVSLAGITEQYLRYLDVLRELDLNTVGEFLEIASTLIEIKSRMVLPRGGEEAEPVDEPRHDLVRQLLEYRKYREAASMLEERGRAWQERFPRLSSDAPAPGSAGESEPLRDAELWDLVAAFSRVLRENAGPPPSSIVYDDTPIHVYMERIQQRLQRAGRVPFSQLFTAQMHKSQLIGVFLAVLELMRHQRVVAEQQELFGEIWIIAAAGAERPIDHAEIDEYEHRGPPPTDSDSPSE